jgi:hypothetical protein
MNDDRAIFKLPQATLDTYCRDVLQAANMPSEDAALVARSLCEADARGLVSHGIVHLLPVYVPGCWPAQPGHGQIYAWYIREGSGRRSRPCNIKKSIRKE